MPNRLAAETSPYLKQHADNPVEWFPWGEEALEKAKREDKPILLSIGYSACHWCHVMAHESFEDDATAQVMNAHFVNVKLDREERPDLDKLYQLAHQALAQRGGGWPLTVFLSPDDLVPFFAGTYFPKTARHGMPPFVYVLERVRDWYAQKRPQIGEQNRAMRQFLEDYASGPGREGDVELNDAPIEHALARLEQTYDERWGGFGSAPKFPHAADLELLARKARAPGDDDADSYRRMHDDTLRHMAHGGIHDQLGGGFCRYSVDERWEIPHFEKMLYDNAVLLPLYARAGRDDAYFAQVARGIVTWLEREMVAPRGAFYAALDADSEGEEGRFYVWQRTEIEALLDADELAVVERHYGFNRARNFEAESWNPIVASPIDKVARVLGIDEKTAAARLESARAKLFAHRAQRVRPGTDDKILTAWNGLMIGALARAARDLGEDRWLALSGRALAFIRAELWRDGRLYASGKGDGSAFDATRFPAYLDDYAFLLDALVERLATRWSDDDVTFAIELADALLEHFEDRHDGGFWFTAHDHERLVARPKSWLDESMPSGNGVAARALLRLGHLIGETRYLDAAQRTLEAGWRTMVELPHGCASLLLALDEWLDPPAQVVIRANASDRAWRDVARTVSAKDVHVFVVPDAAKALPGMLAARAPRAGGVAYLCRGMQCSAPIGSAENLVEALNEKPLAQRA